MNEIASVLYLDGLFKAGFGETSGLVEESEANLKFISRGRYFERRGITIGRRGAVNERLREPHASGSCSGEGDWWWWLRLLVTLKAWRSVRRASLMVCLELFATPDLHLTYNHCTRALPSAYFQAHQTSHTTQSQYTQHTHDDRTSNGHARRG